MKTHLPRTDWLLTLHWCAGIRSAGGMEASLAGSFDSIQSEAD